MAWQDKTYIILPIGDVIQDMIDECLENSADSLRKNIAESEAILKWLDRNGIPDTINILDPAPTQYTDAEIKEFINNPVNGWIEGE